MSYTEARLDRLEARLDDQAARIDALYRMLERRGILPQALEARRGDALFDDFPQSEGEPPVERRAPATGRRRARFHVGTATGV